MYQIHLNCGVSVAVSSLTLMLLSVERYYAICKPLQSRKWQTLAHVPCMLFGIWVSAGLSMVPTLCVYRVVQIRHERFKCHDAWLTLPLWSYELGHRLRRSNMIVQLTLLFIVPLAVMTVAYGCIIHKLKSNASGFQHVTYHFSRQIVGSSLLEMSPAQTVCTVRLAYPGSSSTSQQDLHRFCTAVSAHHSSGPNTTALLATLTAPTATLSPSNSTQVLLGRHNPRHIVHMTTSNRALKTRKRIIAMLLCIVLEFFVCWTPTFVVHTWDAFDRPRARHHIPASIHSGIVLLSYLSTSCNPITYCFMNRSFRDAVGDNVRRMLSKVSHSSRAERYHYGTQQLQDVERPQKERKKSSHQKHPGRGGMSPPQVTLAYGRPVQQNVCRYFRQTQDFRSCPGELARMDYASLQHLSSSTEFGRGPSSDNVPYLNADTYSYL